MAWNTRRDLAACLTWKQLMLGFPSQASRLAKAQQRVMHMASSRRLHRVEVEDGRVNETGSVGPLYPKIVNSMY
jgi:hypothetical protein